MRALCRAYTSEDEARSAVERLLAAGAGGREIRVLMGRKPRDARDEPVGGFGGEPAIAGERVGAFAGAGASARGAMGAFAGEGEDARRGDFGDADRDTVTTFPAGIERERVAPHRGLERMLVEAGLDAATARADVKALHAGRVLVLVELGTLAEAAAAGALDER